MNTGRAMTFLRNTKNCCGSTTTHGAAPSWPRLKHAASEEWPMTIGPAPRKRRRNSARP